MNIGIKKEIDKEYLEAIKNYEEELNDKNYSPPLETFINLAFLYWSLAFEYFEFLLPNNIPEELSITGGNRYPIILELGLQKYPQSSELHFWGKYFQHIIYGEDFSAEDCKNLLDMYKDNSLTPYFFLYLFDKAKYRDKMQILMDEIIKHPTAKNLYIKSIIGRDFLIKNS